jgi:hypothetical protein
MSLPRSRPASARTPGQAPARPTGRLLRQRAEA